MNPHCSPMFSIGLLAASGPKRMPTPAVMTSDIVSVANAAAGGPKRTAVHATSISAVINKGCAAGMGSVSAAALHASNVRPSMSRVVGWRRCQLRRASNLALNSGTTSMMPAMEFAAQ